MYRGGALIFLVRLFSTIQCNESPQWYSICIRRHTSPISYALNIRPCRPRHQKMQAYMLEPILKNNFTAATAYEIFNGAVQPVVLLAVAIS